MILKVPGHYYEVSRGYQFLKLQDITFVSYNQRVEQTKAEVFLAEHAIIFVEEGRKILHINNQEFEIEKGKAIFLQRGCYLMSENLCEEIGIKEDMAQEDKNEKTIPSVQNPKKMPQEKEYKSLMFFFNEKLVKEFLEMNKDILRDANMNEELPLIIDITPTLKNFLQSILFYFNYEGQYLNKFLKLKFHELLLHLISGTNGNLVRKLLIKIYNKDRIDLEFFMEQHFLKPLSIQELAKLSGRSTSSFKRDFYSTFGMAPGQWIRRRCLDHALFLFNNTSKNVSEVALEVGFENTSHFIKAYKSQFGSTPGRMSQKQRLMN